MGVAEDSALFLQVDFEVFGHVQGDLKNLSLTTQFLFSSKNTIIIIVRYVQLDKQLQQCSKPMMFYF